MDEQTMFELLEMYDAVNGLEKIEIMLIGESVATGPGEGIMGNLSYVTEIIRRHYPIYTPGVNYEDTYFGKILEDEEMDNHRKARVLLGITE
jgi:hypothetical protein